jgi:hypothetical protein
LSKDKEWASQSKTLGRFIRELPYVTAWPKYGRDGGFVFRRLSEIDRISPHLMSAVHHVDSQMLGRSGPAIAEIEEETKRRDISLHRHDFDIADKNGGSLGSFEFLQIGGSGISALGSCFISPAGLPSAWM